MPVDQTMTIGSAWAMFQALVLPPAAPPEQRREMRRAFYAGAQSLLDIQMRLDPDDEPTPGDLAVMDSVSRELTDFAEAVRRGEA